MTREENKRGQNITSYQIKSFQLIQKISKRRGAVVASLKGKENCMSATLSLIFLVS